LGFEIGQVGKDNALVMYALVISEINSKGRQGTYVGC